MINILMRIVAIWKIFLKRNKHFHVNDFQFVMWKQTPSFWVSKAQSKTFIHGMYHLPSYIILMYVCVLSLLSCVQLSAYEL